MSMGGKAPDYQGAAQQQQGASQQSIGQQTSANRPDQNTAWGSTSWQQDGNGNWTQNQSLNPQLQGLFDSAVGRQQQGIDYSQFSPVGSGDQARDQAVQGAYSQATSRLDPQWQQRGSDLQAQLANQGLSVGDQAYDRAMANFGRDRNDAYSSAMNGAIAQGTAAGHVAFGDNLAQRQQQIGEATQQMNQPLAGLSGLLGTSGELHMPGFSQAGAWSPANYLGAAGMQGNYQLQNAQQQNQLWGSALGAGGSLGAAAMGIPFGF